MESLSEIVAGIFILFVMVSIALFAIAIDIGCVAFAVWAVKNVIGG